jgi:hypothetical protein
VILIDTGPMVALIDAGQGEAHLRCVELGKFWFKEDTNKWVRWHERYLVVDSQSFAASAIRGQQQRINTAQTALNKLAAKQLP